MKAKKRNLNINLTLLVCSVSALMMVTSCERKEFVAKEGEVISSAAKTENQINVTTEKVNDASAKSLDKIEEISNKINNKISNEISSNNSIDVVKKTADKYINKNSIVIPLNNIYVVDGDTVHANNELGETVKIRMTGIDAPENSQSMGDLSTVSLRDCVQSSGDVKLIADKNNLNDKYGRYLGKIMAGETDCNLSQVQKGMAWFYEDFADNLPNGDAYSFKNAQEAARTNRDGIWMSNPMPPWEYRKNNK